MDTRKITAAIATLLGLMVAITVICCRTNEQKTDTPPALSGESVSETIIHSQGTVPSSNTVDNAAGNNVESTAPVNTVAPTDPQNTSQDIPTTTTPEDSGVVESPFEDDPTVGTEITTPPATTLPMETDGPTGSLDESLTYEAFMDMNAAEQAAFIESFADVDAFFEWYNTAKKVYDEQNSGTEMNGGSIDIGDLLGGD